MDPTKESLIDYLVEHFSGPQFPQEQAREAITSRCWVNSNIGRVNSKGSSHDGSFLAIYPLCWQVAAALSAAVTTTPKQENAPNSHGRTSPEENSSLFPAALRERGVWGRGASLREAASPPRISPTTCSSGRGPRGGASCKEAASPGVLPRHSSTILGFSRLGRYMTKRRPMHCNGLGADLRTKRLEGFLGAQGRALLYGALDELSRL